MQAAAGVRRWRACPPRWRRWLWCVVIVGGGLLLAWSSGAALAVLLVSVSFWLAVRVGGVICGGGGVPAWSSTRPGCH